MSGVAAACVTDSVAYQLSVSVAVERETAVRLRSSECAVRTFTVLYVDVRLRDSPTTGMPYASVYLS